MPGTFASDPEAVDAQRQTNLWAWTPLQELLNQLCADLVVLNRKLILVDAWHEQVEDLIQQELSSCEDGGERSR